MSQTDPVSDMLSAVRNAGWARKPTLDIPASKLKISIADCLKQEGFIQNWRKLSEGNPQGILRVYLKYTKNRRPLIRHIRRVSRPGLRIYVGKEKVHKLFSGIGVRILTTPLGILSDAQARTKGVGGEVICEVW